MKVTIFDRGKYFNAMKTLNERKAPSYIKEAYYNGYSEVVNLYYKAKINKKLGSRPRLLEGNDSKYLERAKNDKRNFLKEAARKNDRDFIKLFYRVSNMDIMSGKRLPPKTGQLLKQAPGPGLGITDIVKRMK